LVGCWGLATISHAGVSRAIPFLVMPRGYNVLNIMNKNTKNTLQHNLKERMLHPKWYARKR